MQRIDFLILAAFIFYSLYSGFKERKRASLNLEEYFLAGRGVPGWKAGISMAATQFAADTPLLVMGLIATAGLFALWQLWIYAISFLLVGFLLAPSWRRARVLTDAEFAELRYGGKAALFLRGFKAVYFGTIFNCAVLAMVLLAATRIAEPFLFWDQWLPSALYDGLRALVAALDLKMTLAAASPDEVLRLSTNNFISIGVIVGVTAMYSMMGGLRSVINTDVGQFALMMLASLIYTWTAVAQAGGLGAVGEGLARLNETGRLAMDRMELTGLDPSTAANAGAALLLAFGVQWLIQMNSDGTGYIAQRIMACRSDRDARIATLVFSFAQILLRSLLWIPLGLALLTLFPPAAGDAGTLFKAEREATFILGMKEHLPPGALGILLTGMLAALASTLDTHLNWGASYWTNDLYRRLYCEELRRKQPSGRSLVWVARLANMLILALSLYVMNHLNSIQEAWQFSLLLGAGMGLPLILRWLWWRMNSWAEIAAILASLAAAPLALALFSADRIGERLLFMAAASLAASAVAIMVAGPESRATLERFVERVRPAGYWGEWDARYALHGRRRLWRGLSATLLAALTLFSLLVAFGSMLADSPAPWHMPYPWTYRVALLVLGLALIPLWWPAVTAAAPARKD